MQLNFLNGELLVAILVRDLLIQYTYTVITTASYIASNSIQISARMNYHYGLYNHSYYTYYEGVIIKPPIWLNFLEYELQNGLAALSIS